MKILDPRQPVNVSHSLMRDLAWWGTVRSPRRHYGLHQDMEGLGRNATAVSGRADLVPGFKGMDSALYFGASADGTDVEITGSLATTTQVTIAIWFGRDASTSNFDSLFENREGILSGFLISSASGNPLMFTWNGHFSIATGLTLELDNRWYFVVGTASSVDGTDKTYLIDSTNDSLRLHTKTNEGGTNPINGTWNIGRDSAQAGRLWDGNIGDIFIIERTLELPEIWDLYRLSVEPYTPLLNWWKPKFYSVPSAATGSLPLFNHYQMS